MTFDVPDDLVAFLLRILARSIFIRIRLWSTELIRALHTCIDSRDRHLITMIATTLNRRFRRDLVVTNATPRVLLLAIEPSLLRC